MIAADMQVHPALAIFPVMSEAEIADLAEDIRIAGQHQAVILDQHGRVLDGRARMEACRLAGLEPVTRTFDVDESDAIGFVASANLKRRHLTTSQRAMIAADLANMGRGRQRNEPANLPVSQTAAANLMNVSERSVRDAAAVKRDGTPELVDQVRKGEVSVSAAKKLVNPKPQRATESPKPEPAKPPRFRQFLSLWNRSLEDRESLRFVLESDDMATTAMRAFLLSPESKELV